MFPMLDLGDELLQQSKTMAETIHSDSIVRDDFLTNGTTIGRNIKFNPKSRINNNRNPRKPSTYRASEGPSSTSKFQDAVDNEHVKKFQSELQDTTKNARASYEYSQLDSLPSHNESVDAHGSNFSASDPIESLEIKAPSCFPSHLSEERACCPNIKDLEAQSLAANEDLNTVEAEHTIDHIEELNLEEYAPSIVQNCEARKSSMKVRSDEQWKTLQSELQDITKSAGANYGNNMGLLKFRSSKLDSLYTGLVATSVSIDPIDIVSEYSQMDAFPSHNELLDAHGSSFSVSDLIESLEIKAPSCFTTHVSEVRACCLNINDLEAQSLTENEYLHIVEVEHTIDHIAESNLEECAPSIVQNGEARKSSMKVRSDEHVKKLQSELQGIKKNASASYEYSQMDSLPSHNELLDAHDSSFSASYLIESVEIEAPNCSPIHSSEERACCLNINDLEAQSLIENEDLHIMEAEHTIDHIEESNLEECAPSIVENGAGKSSMKVRPRKKKLKTNVDNLANTDQIAKNSIPEMDDDYRGDKYKDDDMPKQKKRKLPRKSSKKSKDSEVPGSTANDPLKKRLPHGSSRCKSTSREVKEDLLKILDDDLKRKQLVIKDLIRLASFKEQISNKEAAASKNTFVNKCAEHEQGSNGDVTNEDIQQEAPRLNYHSYMRRTLQNRWSKTDTEFFYQAIRQFGTDFAMIQVLFPNRSRQQVKAKFKNEQRKHPLQIADALVRRSEDHSHFEKVIQHLQTAAEQKAKNTASDSTAQSQDEGVQNEVNHEVRIEANSEEQVVDCFEGGEARSLKPNDLDENDFAQDSDTKEVLI